MKSEGMLAVKIIKIDRQHTPKPRLCSSQVKGVDKDPEDLGKLRIHELGYAQELFQSFSFIPQISDG